MEELGEFPGHHERVVVGNVEGCLGFVGCAVFLVEFVEGKETEFALFVASLGEIEPTKHSKGIGIRKNYIFCPSGSLYMYVYRLNWIVLKHMLNRWQKLC